MNTKFIAVFKKEEQADVLYDYLRFMGKRSFSGRHELQMTNFAMESVNDKYIVTGEYVVGDSAELDYWCSIDRKVFLRNAYFFDDCSYSCIRYYYQTNHKVRYGLLEFQEDVYDLDNDIYMFESAGVEKDVADIVLDYFLKG